VTALQATAKSSCIVLPVGSDRAAAALWATAIDGVMQGPSGVTIQVYRPTGRPQYATATADLKQ